MSTETIGLHATVCNTFQNVTQPNRHHEDGNCVCVIRRTLSPRRRTLNAMNSGAKVPVVVINKHAQRDLVFDKKVKEQVVT